MINIIKGKYKQVNNLFVILFNYLWYIHIMYSISQKKNFDFVKKKMYSS